MIVAQQEETPDAKANAILQNLNKKTKTYKTISAKFNINMNGKDKSSEEQKGSIMVKGGKYRLELKSQTILCDSVTLWTVLKDANEVQVNNVDAKNDKSNLSPATLFNLYEKDFKSHFDNEEQKGNSLIEHIDLYPKHPEREKYHTIKLSIDKNKNEVTQIDILMKDGDSVMYSILSFNANDDIPDSTFTFNKNDYPGIEVEDLRE